MRMAVLVIAAALGLLGGGPPAEEVDFGAPPLEGVWFSRFRKIRTEIRGEVRAGELGTQRLRQWMAHEEDYSEKIDRVENGKVVALKRQYVAATTTSETETDRMLNPSKDQHEELYSGLDFQVEWKKDGKMDLSVTYVKDPSQPDDLGYQDASPAVRAALEHAFDYPGPFLAADGHSRRVGDSWELSEDAINRILPRRPDHLMKGAIQVTFDSVDPELEVNVSTVHQDEDGRLMEDPPVKRKVPCAVLKCQAAIRVKPPEGLPLTLEFTGTLHYSLEHRLIVQFDLEGKLHVKGSLRDYSFDHSGDYRDEMLLRFHRLAPAEDRPSGEEPKNG